LGEPLFKAYNLTLDYANLTLTLSQWTNGTLPKPDNNHVDDLESEGRLISILLFVLLLLIIGGLLATAYICQKRRQLKENLQEKLH